MRAIEITKNGGPDVLKLVDRAKPVPGQNEVLIRVSAAGLNRADLLQRRGLYPAPAGASDIPGLEVAGLIDSVGPNVTRFKRGEHVCALLPGGGYAEYATASADICAHVPPGLSMVDAAALPEALFTVWNNVFLRGRLRPTETILVHGGTSGIGSMAIQLAAAFGGIVYATTSDNDKKNICLKLGARQAINRIHEDYVSVLKKQVPNGLNLVLDLAGGDTFGRDLDILGLDGRHVSIAHMEGKTAAIDIPTLMQKRLILTGSTLRGRPLAEQTALARDLDAHVWPLVATGRIRALMDKTFPLEQATAAHKHMESGQHIGKIVLTV